MNKFLKTFFALVLGIYTATPAIAQQQSAEMWYQQPAKDWMEASPIGNGRLGAMVYGGINRERVALNEITLWSGQRDEAQNDICGKENLAKVREPFLKGDYKTGNELARQYLSGKSKSFGTHLPLGDLIIESSYPKGDMKNYRRSLDLTTAVATTTFEQGGVTFTREYICSYPNDVIAICLTANKQGAINTTVSTDFLRKCPITASGNRLTFDGKVDYPMFGEGGVNFAGTINVDANGGKVTTSDGKITVAGANKVTITVDVRTDMFDANYKELAKATADAATKAGFTVLKRDHIADHSALYNRMSIKLGNQDNSNLATDVRLHLIKNGAIDTDFEALFFQYGRYMQIASSRPNSPLCSNLQGIWNDNRACHMAWTCDYHLDINIQQNYWSVNKVNLDECNIPLFKYVDLLRKYGSITAKKVYGCNGWVAHTITNPWGYTSPGGDPGWGLNVTGGAWLATHLWSHYLYTRDVEYLREVGYPLLKSCAEFFMDYMVEDPATGYLVTGPSVSPENGLIYNGRGEQMGMMPTLDRTVVFEIYTACIESAKILGIDKKLRKRLEKDIKRLPPLMIGSDGQLQEWMADARRIDPLHRHASHLHSLYPMGHISATRTPELMDGARKFIVAQTTDPNWENTEWSCANNICFNSFLRDGEKSHHWIQDLFHKFTRENLMTVSPKGIAGAAEDIFSFDATEASVAGMCDMIMQSHDGFIEFLPALPDAWSDGEVNGICAQGALVLDMKWTDKAMKTASIRAKKDATVNILLPANANNMVTIAGKTSALKVDKQGIASFKLKADQSATLQFK